MGTTMDTKVCTKCNEEKPLDDFSKEKTGRNGIMAICRACNCARARAWAVANREKRNETARRGAKRRCAENPEKYRAIQRAHYRRNADKRKAAHRQWLKDNADHVREYNRAYRADNPDAWRARNALNHEIRKGRMERQPCAVCGATKTDAHHEDHNKPLDVVWLCRTHHALIHRSDAPPLSVLLASAT